MKTNDEYTVIYPFTSDQFMMVWEAWLDYKWEVHKFKYKSDKTMQVALKRLGRLSNNDEITALEMIEQSMANQWMDIYPLNNKQNGTESESNSVKESIQRGNSIIDAMFG